MKRREGFIVSEDEIGSSTLNIKFIFTMPRVYMVSIFCIMNEYS